VINDDEKWRGILRGLQSTYRHQVVTGKQVQDYISTSAGIDFTTVYQQYLTTIMIPVLEYKVEDGKAAYRWSNTVPGFELPIRAGASREAYQIIRPTSEWQAAPFAVADSLQVDPNYYIDVKRIDPTAP
jgi:hypothetical protein